MRGRLEDMSVADLIQFCCSDRKSAELVIAGNGGQATLFFVDGDMVHAALGNSAGEEVVFEVLEWSEGEFSVEGAVDAPARTINDSWQSLIIEGAKRLDEKRENASHHQEVRKMDTKKKGEALRDTLLEVLSQSTDIDGAAVVGSDGLVYSINAPKGTVDENLVGAVAAAVLGASKRSAEQLGRGEFALTLIQGDKGNIIVTPLNKQILFVALTRSDVNLGMAFAETRTAGKTLVDIL